MNNKIPTGYKKTEIGIIPEDWEVKRLGEVSKIVGRIGFRGYTKKDIVKPWRGAISLSPINIVDGKLNLKSNLTFVSWNKYEESPEIKIKTGDIIFVKTGSTLGKVAIIEKVVFPTTINPQLVIIKVFKRTNNKFINFYLNSFTFKNLLNKVLDGQAIPTLSQYQLSNLLLPLPPLPEQKDIAKVLSDIDNLIESLDKLIEKKKLIKKGAMQELLTGKKRLQGFKGKWVKMKLGEVFDIKRGASPRPIEKYITKKSNGINWIKISDVKPEDKYLVKTEIKITQEGAKQSVVVNYNDLILSNSMSYGRPYISKIKGCIHDGWLLLKRKGKQNIEFFYYLLSSYKVQKSFDLLAAGSGVNNLKIDSVKELSIYIPPTLEEQQAIAKILSDMDAEIEALKKKKEKYEQIKKGAMELLLTGKVRLKTINNGEGKNNDIEGETRKLLWNKKIRL
ncbi:MAG TPA: restriction endonuclease subunit S [Persephonella sp.]|uniref:Type I restriction-modification system specificty subunit n=1 Tax=Persephonella marina (strain DSM 14350 / EX-H1) TaxID=123214 RepID=C0QQY4_PERMH|nr:MULTISPECIES: restriction endonuclease subunit S [Persephonella]ACO03339.1 type I restriction-modification system specificty subunit [Persephonella marina EX-H1]HCB68829.1 restriction endonuclease subunit S [Persephonella sp.]